MLQFNLFVDLQKITLKENLDQEKVPTDLPAIETKRRLVFEVTANTSNQRKNSNSSSDSDNPTLHIVVCFSFFLCGSVYDHLS